MEKQLDEIESDGKKWIDILTKFYRTFSEDLEKADKAKKIGLPPVYSEEICDICGRTMLIKNGRFGKFLACSGFPECKNTKPILNKIGVPCPKEDCPGEIIKKNTKKGRIFYGCSNYPKCSFVSWDKPIDKKCPKCNSILIIKRNKKRGFQLKCSNSNCEYQEILKEVR